VISTGAPVMPPTHRPRHCSRRSRSGNAHQAGSCRKSRSCSNFLSICAIIQVVRFI